MSYGQIYKHTRTKDLLHWWRWSLQVSILLKTQILAWSGRVGLVQVTDKSSSLNHHMLQKQWLSCILYFVFTLIYGKPCMFLRCTVKMTSDWKIMRSSVLLKEIWQQVQWFIASIAWFIVCVILTMLVFQHSLNSLRQVISLPVGGRCNYFMLLAGHPGLLQDTRSSLNAGCVLF